jgi:uncharacterized damage-inducible protein DinB
MIDPPFARTMAAYNAEMNRRFYDAAASLRDDERKAARGVFWSSIHGTLSHLIWADQMWLSRFTGSPKPAIGLKDSSEMFERFDEMAEQRRRLDSDIATWANGLDPSWLAGDLTWFSGAAERIITLSAAVLVTHFFNHQTHHRGQVHALLTRAGANPGDTDLFLVL